MRIGVDEAGKGPVLGPMVAAAVRADPEALPDGIADSKRLTPVRREELAAKLRERDDIAVGVAFIEPATIDDPETDMNLLTVRAQVEAAAAVAADDDELVCDAGDVSESRFGRRVRDGVAEAGASVEVHAQHRADDEHAIVGAASIVAKVERDRRVAAIADEYGEVGSGYPSDQTTRDFLREFVREHGILPDCARKSWSTCADLLAAHEQSSLGDF
ncbi:ribonuclease HII [Haloferax mediterranei ATCC 33500]|uniref:Ribonuclease HII n=1 Tax=Haloferax mediterranei (strain ATCC 33500 / DSM 1411 / JCM 8866 / NBRC 14739 / NCIMB 2177 / R-4) TaxID=523841 RepID=I3R6A3_HALMT|nr:ribonuclease HII [Haloferax mediterranei]AFK19763.1 ribonuclease HII [Haloferax mediterranei ATCC 33500]AHZ23149.1 ribonuclease HII [Haloferax mediterranei ATCC 33500]EMA00085.1 ribonuclease HII [Haloferax mediterranei ATCC 33500]MDX5987492.1 ribonuclease HII [Haloferax mediterranei ATCC 33500]QCQ73992.1 ribonuclease HII [Haloferax mediterranei ATCC 33500]